MSGSVQEVTADHFDSEVLGVSEPVIVDFWAPWCGPCRMVGPEFEKLAAAHGTSARFVRVNVDEAGDIAMRYGIMSIPTLVKFDKGEVVKRIVGARGADAMAKEFDLA